MPGPANSLNISTIGIQYFNGINAFSGVAGTTGQVLQANTSSAPTYSTATYPSVAGTSGNVLTSNGTNWVSLAPATSGTVTSVSVVTANGFAGTVATATTTPAITLTTTITGVLSGNGTSISGSAVTQFDVLVGGASNAISSVGPGSAGQVLQSGGNAANPAYSTATYPSTATGTGTLLRADGTNWVATTSTYPNTNAINTLLYASSANVMSALATANNGTLITSATGVPSWLANGTTGQVLTATTGSPPSWAPPATSGTVTSVSGTANQVAVANGTTTPVISLIGPYTPATYTAHGVLIGEGTSSIVATSTGSAGQHLQSGGASADPNWTTATFPATATSTGTILRADGTNWVASTNTYPNTATAGALIAATATNVIGQITDVAVGQVLTSGGVGAVPVYSATPTVTSITFGAGTALSTYVQGTFTPVLSFGGGTTGITYTTQIGQYTQIGNIVFFKIKITLSSKGSSTGNAIIDGLPVASVNNGNVFVTGFYGTVSFTSASYTYAAPNVVANATTIGITEGGNNVALGNIPDTSFSNTSQLNISGFYFTS